MNIYLDGTGPWKGPGAKHIPLKTRTLVRERDKELCIRCHGRGSQWHHRRSRGVIRPHRHCPCNGLWLCRTCHTYVHSNPVSARNLGLILEREEDLPFELPVRTWDGWRYHLCDGTYEWVNPAPDGVQHPTQYRKERR